MMLFSLIRGPFKIYLIPWLRPHRVGSVYFSVWEGPSNCQSVFNIFYIGSGLTQSSKADSRLLEKTILAPSSTNPTGGWLYPTMTTSREAPKGAPPPPHLPQAYRSASDIGHQKIESRESFLNKSMKRQTDLHQGKKTVPTMPQPHDEHSSNPSSNSPDPPTLAGMTNANLRIDRQKSFCAKSAKMKELFKSELSPSNDSNSSTHTTPPTTTKSPKVSSSQEPSAKPNAVPATKKQANISDMFQKLSPPQNVPDPNKSKNDELLNLNKLATTTDPKVSSDQSTTEVHAPNPKGSYPTSTESKSDVLLDDAMIGIELSDLPKHEIPVKNDTTPRPSLNMTSPFLLATQTLINPITHGTSPEICTERIKFDVFMETSKGTRRLNHPYQGASPSRALGQ